MTGGGAALITGGATRVGRELALALARRGIDVAIHCNRSGKAARETAADASRLGVNSAVCRCDLRDENDVLTLVGQAASSLGRPLTVLINNAASFNRDRIETATLSDWHVQIGTNLQAPFFLTQQFALQVPEAKTDANGEKSALGAIVNLVDQRVLRPTSEFATYTLSKAALWSLTQSSAVALAPNIRVNAIGPGPTIPSTRQTREHFRRQRQGTPLGRGADVAEIAAAMNFILDAPSMTGQLLCIDGGQFIKWKYSPAGEERDEPV